MAEFSHGPWKEMYKGEWNGYETCVYSNPDMLTLTTISDKKGEGWVCIMNKYFVFEGDISKFTDNIKGYLLVFEKHYPAVSAKYISISNGPFYSKKASASSDIDGMYKEMQFLTEKVNEMSAVYSANLTELKHAKTEYYDWLFSEPSMLPGLITGKLSERMISGTGAKTILGKKVDGTPAEESIQSFARTVVIGRTEEMEKMFHIILENCVLGGINGVVIDENDYFTDMSSPDSSFKLSEYPALQPIGMPLKTQKIADVQIDLNLFTKSMFREILEMPISGEEYCGKKSAELIDAVIENRSGHFNSLTDIIEALMKNSTDDNKSYTYKAMRWLIVLEKKYPGCFAGKMELRKLIPTYMKSIGSIIRLDAKDLSANIRKALFYSIIKSAYDEFKKTGGGRQINVLLCVLNGERYIPHNPEKPIEQALTKVLADCYNYGVGFCISAETDHALFEDLVENSTLRIDFVSEGEVAVKEANERAYRMELRPRLSA
ncbi:MAG: hypothetical protein V1911_02875 [Candidatus Micrarchaeota archaeon]